MIWLARGAGTLPIKRIGGDPLRKRDLLAVGPTTWPRGPTATSSSRAQTVVEAIETAGPTTASRSAAAAAAGPFPGTWGARRQRRLFAGRELFRDCRCTESSDSCVPSAARAVRSRRLPSSPTRARPRLEFSSERGFNKCARCSRDRRQAGPGLEQRRRAASNNKFCKLARLGGTQRRDRLS